MSAQPNLEVPILISCSRGRWNFTEYSLGTPDSLGFRRILCNRTKWEDERKTGKAKILKAEIGGPLVVEWAVNVAHASEQLEPTIISVMPF